MTREVIKDAERRMQKSLEALGTELSKLRTGRAHPSLLDHVTVDYYGTEVPIGQASNVSVEDARTLAVQPYDKSMTKALEKAIMNSNLGLNPSTSGDTIRVILPPLTEERRKEIAKLARNEAENARVAIRNIRRDANNQFKAQTKEKTISEDEEHRAEDEVQKVTDKFIGKVDEILADKESDLMEI